MGTDIHMEVEVRSDGIWKRHEHWDEACDFCADGKGKNGAPCYWCKGTRTRKVRAYSDRNYDVFAILADVRNGYGFAGCDTGDGFVPIAEPRGLPADLSFDPEAEDADGDCAFELGDHSQTWLTLDEVLAYDWDRTTKKRGHVDPWNFELFRREGSPRSWSGGISGSTIEHVSNAAMAKMIDSGEIQWVGPEPDRNSWIDRPYTTSLQREMKSWPLPVGSVGAAMAAQGRRYYTIVEWEEEYRDSAAEFLRIVEERLRPLAADPRDVRLVFGFDS